MGKNSHEPTYKAALAALASWFERQKRVLPWRDTPTLYKVWISEIMLQQTQVVTVIPFFERFVARFPDVEALAGAPLDAVMLHWAGLGYYSRARNLHAGAKMIEAHGFPRDRDGWLGIPGVGNYTAGAILSIALDQPEAILDGNVERVLSRVRMIGRESGDADFKERLWDASREWVERAHSLGIRPSVLNQALMELGATLCSPKKPKCLLCPLAALCQARAQGMEEEYPPRKKPKEWIPVDETVHFIFRESLGSQKSGDSGQILLRQRMKGEWRAGLWDLLDEEPGKLGMGRASFLGKVESKHVVTRHKITRTTHVWSARTWKAAEQSFAADGGLRWISFREPEVAVGSALQRTFSLIRERFPEGLGR